MKGKFKCLFALMLALMVFIIPTAVASAATIGTKLTNPESGWQRYDNAHSNLYYEGEWEIFNNGSHAFWNGSFSYLLPEKEGALKFKFRGTKLRFIQQLHNSRSSKVQVKIDGEVVGNYSTYNGSIYTDQCLVYEKTGLENKIHYVELANLDSGRRLAFDALDIDSTGELLPYDKVEAGADLKVVLGVNEELQLSVSDDLDDNTDLTWTSSDDTVATVDANGVVKGLKPGNTVIIVVDEDGTYKDQIKVLVVENPDEYRLAIDLKVGKTARLTVDDLSDTVKVTWDSSDPSVATVSSKGKVKAVSKGLTLITAKDEDGNIIGQVYVRVRE